MNFARLKNAWRVLNGERVLDPSSVTSVEAFLRTGETVDTAYAAAKRCSTVYACVRLLSDAIASLPLKLIKEAEDGRREPGVSDPLYWLLSTAPCPWMDKIIYWKFNINCLLLRGLFVSHVIRSGNGKIIRLVPVNPMRIDVEGIALSATGELLFPIQDSGGNRRIYPASELFFCYYETLDGIRPVTPLRYARETIRLARNAEKYGNDTLQNGAVLPGYYTCENKIGQEAFERLRSQLSENGVGSNSGKAPLLDNGLHYNTVSMTAEDMQMLETRRYQKEEICGIFGVPPHLIGDTAQAKGWSTMEQTMTEFLQLSLTPYLVRIENAVTTRLIPPQMWGKTYAKFNVGGLLRGDTTARTNYYRTLNQIGAMSANEIRAKEDMNAVEGGDEFYVPANMTPVKEEKKDESSKTA